MHQNLKISRISIVQPVSRVWVCSVTELAMRASGVFVYSDNGVCQQLAPQTTSVYQTLSFNTGCYTTPMIVLLPDKLDASWDL